MLKANVMRSGESTPIEIDLLSIDRCNEYPSSAMTGRTAIMPSHKLVCPATVSTKKAASIEKSPCARLTIRITPKTSDNPAANNA